jgi:hypothetical protein
MCLLLNILALVIESCRGILIALCLLAFTGLFAILAPVAGVLFSNILFYVLLQVRCFGDGFCCCVCLLLLHWDKARIQN